MMLDCRHFVVHQSRIMSSSMQQTLDAESASDSNASSSSEVDTEEEISASKAAKSAKTRKRKLRATSPSQFGATLTGLISEEASADVPLALKPHLERQRRQEREVNKERRVHEREQKDLEERGRIQDVIGGWGGESERALRKIAQRGVIKLFNAVEQTQKSSMVAGQCPERAALKATGKATERDNMLGRGKDNETVLGQEQFLDIIRGGGLVSQQ